MKRRYHLAHFVTLLIILAFASTIASSFSSKLLQLTLFESIILLIALLLMLFPIGKRIMHSPTTKDAAPRPTWLWLGQIVGIQLGFYLLLYAFAIPLFSSSMPAQDLAQQGGNLFMLGIISNLLYQGLHPWPIIGCLAIGIGTLGAAQQQEKLSGITRPLFTKMPPPAFFSAFDIASTLGFIFWIMALLAVMLYQLSQTTHAMLHLPALEFGHYLNIYVCGVVAIVLLNRHFHKLISRMSFRSNTLGPLILYLFIAMALLILGSLLIYYWLPDALQMNLTQEYFLRLFVETDQRIAWLLISWSFGISLAPTLAAWINQISHGKSVRQVLAAILLLPVTFSVLLYWLASIHPSAANELPTIVHQFNWLLHQGFSPSGRLLLPLLIFAGFIYVLSTSQALNNGLVQLTANQAGKSMRRYRKMFLNTGAFLMWFLLLFMYTGISGMQFLLTLTGILVVLFALPLPLVALLRFSMQR